MIKVIHFVVTMKRAASIIRRLDNERNFKFGKSDDATMQLIVEFVMQRTLNDDQIIEEILEMHTIEMPLS